MKNILRTLALSSCALFLLSAEQAFADSFTFEDASVTASAQQISVVRLPVVSSTGSVSYKNVVIQFTYANGKLAFATGYPKVTSSPTLASVGLTAGIYTRSGGSDQFELTGPLAGPDGRSKWILTETQYSRVLEFYTGAITGHPLQARLNKAGLNAPYTYGYAVAGTNGDVYTNTGDLLAVAPISTTSFAIYDYTSVGVDHKLAVDTYIMKKK